MRACILFSSAIIRHMHSKIPLYYAKLYNKIYRTYEKYGVRLTTLKNFISDTLQEEPNKSGALLYTR